MKKLILSTAIILGALTVSASTTAIKTPLKQLITVQDEYKEIDAVPAEIKTALENSRALLGTDKETFTCTRFGWIT